MPYDVRKHVRKIGRGRRVTVRQHERGGGASVSADRMVERPAEAASPGWQVPPPQPAPPPDDSELWADDEAPADWGFTDDPEPDPEMSPAFAAMVAQNPSLDGDAYRRIRAERASGYKGPLDQDGRRPDLSDPEQAEAAAILARMQDTSERKDARTAAALQMRAAQKELAAARRSRDKEAIRDAKAVTDGGWYSGVPLWSLAESRGMRSACLPPVRSRCSGTGSI